MSSLNLKVAAALLPKQVEIETNRTRPLSELSDAELIKLILGGRIDVIVEALLIFRGHAPLSSAQLSGTSFNSGSETSRRSSFP
jgi:hypothetical protein